MPEPTDQQQQDTTQQQAGTQGANDGAQGTSQQTQQTGADGQAARTGAVTTGQFTYTEDRSKWLPPDRAIPKHRFDEVNQRAQRAQELETELATTRRQLQALTGVTPADPNAAKAEQLKEAFFNLPGMGILRKFVGLSEQQIDRLLQLPDSVDRVSESENREWARHGKAQMATVYEQVADAIGAEQLSDDQKSDLKESFSAWFKRTCVAELEASGGQESKTLQRYEDADPTLLQDFVKRYTANWVEPARRRVTQQTLTRTRPVPNSQGRTPVTSVKRPEKFASLDDRLDFAVNLGKERGMQFGQ